MDVGHLLAGGELRVRDVEELGAADERDQALPRRDVRLLVGGVAVQQAVRERHCPVSADREGEHELLKVGAVALGTPQRCGDGRLARARAAVGAAVSPCTVIDVESLCSWEQSIWNSAITPSISSVKSDARSAAKSWSSARPTRSSLSSSPCPRLQAQQCRVIPPGPVAEAMERLARHAEVGRQHADHGGGSQRHAGVAGRQVAAQDALPARPGQERVHDRQRPPPALRQPALPLPRRGPRPAPRPLPLLEQEDHRQQAAQRRAGRALPALAGQRQASTRPRTRARSPAIQAAEHAEGWGKK